MGLVIKLSIKQMGFPNFLSILKVLVAGEPNPIFFVVLNLVLNSFFQFHDS